MPQPLRRPYERSDLPAMVVPDNRDWSRKVPPDDTRYTLDLLVSVKVYADSEKEAEQLAGTYRNWDDWDLIEVQSTRVEGI
jgi:hypothetical protein